MVGEGLGDVPKGKAVTAYRDGDRLLGAEDVARRALFITCSTMAESDVDLVTALLERASRTR